jgi:pimeloyl-ACP methyl ester carboxylesterase
MALGKESRFRTDQRVQHLRAAMGVRATAASCDTNGYRVAWEEAGDTQGQAVICLHDAGSGGREFRPLLRQRLAGIRLIVLDWPCHGRSGEAHDEFSLEFSLEQCASVLLAFVNQLGIARPILLGHGFGAAVAIRFAVEHPARVRGLVLSQPAGLFAPIWKPLGIWGSWMLRAKTWLWGKPMTPSERQEWRRFVFNRAAVHADRNALDWMGRVSADLKQAQPELRSALASLPCPILFAFSRESHNYPLKAYLALLDPLLKTAPQHRFTVFTGAYHPVWDEPERFAQALSGFVQALLPLDQHHHAWLLTAVDWPTRAMNLWKCVHPECDAEQVLPEGQNANDSTSQSPAL